MSLQADITSRLEAQGAGTFGDDLYWGVMPEDPIDIAAVYETAGPQGEYTKGGAATTTGRLQVLTRSEDYSLAMTKALSVYSALDSMRQTISGTRYSVRALQRPFDVGAQDIQGRTIISCNYEVRLWPT